MKFDIIYEDDDIVAVNKPSGLLSIPDRYNNTIPCLYHQMAAGYEKLFVVHRLDKDTSGLIVFAKNEDSHKYMSQLFEGRDVEKYYLAIVNGRPIKEAGTIIAPIAEHPTHKGRMSVQKKGRFAHTDYELKQTWNGFSLLRLRIFTGRTHQIRVHMQHIGHPLFNDDTYGGNRIVKGTIFAKYKQFIENCFEIIPRHALHAQTLGFIHPRTRQPIQFESPLPDDFKNVLEKWRRYVAARPLEE